MLTIWFVGRAKAAFSLQARQALLIDGFCWVCGDMLIE